MSGLVKFAFDGGHDILLSKLGEDLFDDANTMRLLHMYVQKHAQQIKTKAGREHIDKVSKILHDFQYVPSDSQRSLRNIRVIMNFKDYSCAPPFANGAILILTREDAVGIRDVLRDEQPQKGDIFVSEVHARFICDLLTMEPDSAKRLSTSRLLRTGGPSASPPSLSAVESALLRTKQYRCRSVPPSLREVPATLREVRQQTNLETTSLISRLTRTTGDAPRDYHASQRDYGERGVCKAFKLKQKGPDAVPTAESFVTFGDSCDTFTIGNAATETLNVPDDTAETLDACVARFAESQARKDPSGVKQFKVYAKERMQQFVKHVVSPTLKQMPVAKHLEEMIMDKMAPRDALQDQHVKLSDMTRECFRSDRLRVALQVRGESRFSDMSAKLAIALSDHMKREFGKVVRKNRVSLREKAPKSIAFEWTEATQGLAEQLHEELVSSTHVSLDGALVCALEELDNVPLLTKREHEAALASQAQAQAEQAQAQARVAERQRQAVFAAKAQEAEHLRHNDPSKETFRVMASEVHARLPPASDSWRVDINSLGRLYTE